MARGISAKEGATYVSDNGYHHTKQNGKFRPTHHIIAEKTLGRPLQPDERVVFGEKGKTDLSPDNITVVRKAKKTTPARIAALEAKIEELQDELETLKTQL